MKFIKKHKFTILVIIVFILAVIVLFWAWNLFFTNSGRPEYGNRLDGIEKVEITTNDISNIVSKTKENKKVKEVTTNISGRTLDIVITVDDKVSINDAKDIASKAYSSLAERQIDYYSIQVFVKKIDSSKNNFPIIGYKQRGTKSIVWTKDRKVTTTNESE